MAEFFFPFLCKWIGAFLNIDINLLSWKQTKLLYFLSSQIVCTSDLFTKWTILHSHKSVIRVCCDINLLVRMHFQHQLHSYLNRHNSLFKGDRKLCSSCVSTSPPLPLPCCREAELSQALRHREPASVQQQVDEWEVSLLQCYFGFIDILLKCCPCTEGSFSWKQNHYIHVCRKELEILMGVQTSDSESRRGH